MSVKTLLRSFAGGIIAPELFGRVDLAKNQTGLQQCLNFEVLPHGPVVNRPGFEYINEAKSNGVVRIIPFSFNTEQTYIIELGDQYIRFFTNGAQLLSAAQNITAISQANPGVLTYAGTDPANGSWGYLTGIGGMTELNGRYVKVANVNAGANTFELTDLAGNNINTTGYGAYTAGGTFSPVYEIASPYLAADLFDIGFEQNADVLTFVHPNYAPRELSRLGAANWQLSVISFAPAVATPAAPTLATSAAGATSYSYKCTAVATDGLEESLASPAASITNDLATAGRYIDIDPPVVAGAERYNIYKLKTGGIYGYIGQSDGSAFRDNNIEPDVTRVPPTASTPFTGAGNYPGAVGYFEQRRCFGGTDTKPLNLWMTRSATESNLSYSIPTQDDDSIVIKIVSRQVNRVLHIVPLSDLLLLTPGSEIRVYADNAGVLTPNNVTPRGQSYVGASKVRPVVTNVSALYVQAQGSHIRELLYSFENNKYNSNDTSLLCPHLFENFTIDDMTYSRAPVQTAYAVRSDGKIVGLTYVPEQQVMGYHLHDTLGEFKSVACIVEDNEDVLYAVVQRELNGRTVNCIERKHRRYFAALEDAFFVDCGVSYSGAAATTISGLWHLEGETVSILGDGAVFPQQVVTNGRITLDNAVSKAHIGLPITADVETLPMALEAEAAGQGITKNINGVYMRVYRSQGIFVGANGDSLTEVPPRRDEPFGSPPDLRSEVLDVRIDGEWTNEGTVLVRQVDPLPLTIVSITLDVALGG